jgi:hypothetical protein
MQRSLELAVGVNGTLAYPLNQDTCQQTLHIYLTPATLESPCAEMDIPLLVALVAAGGCLLLGFMVRRWMFGLPSRNLIDGPLTHALMH